jgi:hypothetical protein
MDKALYGPFCRPSSRPGLGLGSRIITIAMIVNSWVSAQGHGLCLASRAGWFGAIWTVSTHGIGNCSSATFTDVPCAYGTGSSQSA